MLEILGLFIPSFVLTVLPFLASCIFDSQQSHGVVSFDAFSLLLCFLISRQKFGQKYLLLLAPLIYAFVGSGEFSAINGLLAAVLLLVSLSFPLSKKAFTPYCFVMFLILLVLDAGNFFYSTFSLSLTDVWQVASFYWWGILLFVFAPILISLGLAVGSFKLFKLKIIRELSLARGTIYFLLVVSITFVQNNLFGATPIFEFTSFKFVERVLTPGQISQSSILLRDAKEKFPIWSENLESSFYREKKTIVEILVESWGVSKNVELTESLLDIFPDDSLNISFKGLLPRAPGHTQGAEWEDFKTLDGKKTEMAIPLKMKNMAFKTWYVHGYDGKFYDRVQNYGEFGFEEILFKEDFLKKGLSECKYGFEGICDSSMIGWLDELLADSSLKYIYWTTLDAHPPYDGQHLSNEELSYCRDLSLNEIECIYYNRQRLTLNNIKLLIEKHPNVRFVIKGDHRPMGSLAESDFVASFYYKWVSLVIVN